MATAKLDQRGTVKLEGVVLRTQGLRGQVTVDRVTDGDALRAQDLVGDALEDALGKLDMRTELRIEIADPQATITTDETAETRGRPGASGGLRPQDLELEVPTPQDDYAQILFSIDEHGIATFHRPEAAADVAADDLRGRATLRYVVPRVVAPPPDGTAATTRGLVPGLSHVIRVITFPIAKAVGQLGQSAARSWDQGRHPHQVRRRLATGSWGPLDDAGWAELEKGPALLFIHGTFSTSEGGFGALPEETWAELLRRYDGRVIAFDHPTIADDPGVNVRRLLELVGDRALELDVVCHSRGGLVARTLAERPGALRDIGPNVTVRTVVLVAATCNGTILASADHWDELVNRATTLLALVPNVALDATMETILAVVRSIAVEVVKDLEGLDCMAPGSDFLKLLNDPAAEPPDSRYVAIVSNYEPRDPALTAWLTDVSRDLIFEDKPNDLMVTIDSMIGANGNRAFPVTVHRDFEPDEGIEHSSYFGQPKTSRALLEWLAPDRAAVPGGG
jgi:hypothetical protein